MVETTHVSVLSILHVGESQSEDLVPSHPKNDAGVRTERNMREVAILEWFPYEDQREWRRQIGHAVHQALKSQSLTEANHVQLSVQTDMNRPHKH